ncbi:hypothetical protein [Corynebacterium frankenforstense]|uniref:hypothetical protein n=1 Tax=Corynebacterium frankenforstense TaxID=1230998 RepID=UPI0025510D39|nr:hypothetical protein [Corynebacterium frankenforstense]MDK6259200.1 hypothetical protein [Corynebacterium frankenforstense]
MTSPARIRRTRPHRLNARPRALTAAVLAACAFGATSCSVLGPRPDAAVLELARGTLAAAEESDSLLRAQQADQLFDEVERLCGEPLPESCAVERTTDGVVPAGLKATVDAVDEVPEESADLVAAQAVDLAVAENEPGATDEGAGDGTVDADVALPDPEDVSVEGLTEEDAEALRELLSWEQALRYGLTSAAAWAGPQDALVAAGDRRAAVLTALLEQADTPVPSPATGYEFEVAPAELPARAAEDTAALWTRTAAGIGADAVRAVVVSGAANATLTNPTR